MGALQTATGVNFMALLTTKFFAVCSIESHALQIAVNTEFCGEQTHEIGLRWTDPDDVIPESTWIPCFCVFGGGS